MNSLQAGLLLIDKPIGVTSHAVVAFLKRSLGLPRVGHLGTLDPFASGVLPILLGGMTRMADALMASTKGYRFRIVLGEETDTLDPTGQVIAREAPPGDLSPEAVEKVLTAFRGTIRQVPPAYSAIKHKGRPLYEYMRTQGKLDFALEDRAREIAIESLLDVSTESDRHAHTLVLEVSCSKGTYVRCLARDIALALGSVGHCGELRRLAVGPWTESKSMALSPETILGGRQRPSPDPDMMATLSPRILSLRDVFDRHEPAYPSVCVPGSEPELVARIRSGNRVRVTFERFSQWLMSSGSHSPAPLAPEGFLETPDRIFFSTFSLSGADNEGDTVGPLWVDIEPRKQIAALTAEC